jgi:GT2 family glycosyltransferase/8-oxo-dGTP pyrophosphatase MutT (NUDIX family)
MSKLTVQLVTWNGAKYIPFLFESLRAQTYTDWELCVFDNASSDATVEVIEKELALCQFPCTFEKSTTNTGFAGGHNHLYKTRIASEYILLLNQDMYLMPDCLQNMATFLDEHPQTAAVSPRLMRWHFNACRVEEGVCKVDGSHTDDIDALGLKIFRNRRVVEWYTKQSWHDSKVKKELQFDSIPVFGVSGAFPLYRRSALRDTELHGGEFLDTSYHSYKEDVDLAYRLRSAGYESFVLTNTVAYHDRSGAGPKRMGDISAVMNKRTQSEWVTYHSYKNHLMTLYKNEYLSNVLWDLPFILFYEFKKFVWFLLFKPSVLGGLFECIRLRHTLRHNRSLITKRRRVGAGSIRSWWRRKHIRQESFGVVPVFVDRTGEKWFLLVKEKRGQHWAFPKGRPEVCETPEQSALRELQEETGIGYVTLDTVHPFIHDYVFDGRSGVILHKTVMLFVGMCTHMETQLQSSEVADRVWLQYEEARRLLTHEASRRTLDEVEQYLLRST